MAQGGVTQQTRVQDADKTAMGGIGVYQISLFVAWMLIAGTLTYTGLSYYSLPLQERPFNEAYDLYKPGGTIGLNLGVVGTAFIAIGVAIYAVRKRVRRFSKLGKLRHWLSFHIFLCTLGPFLVLLHTSFKFSGLVAVSFLSMIVVVISGIIGRFLYVRVPKTINGRFQSLQVVQAQKDALLSTIEAQSGVTASELQTLLPPVERNRVQGFLPAVGVAFRYGFDRRKRKGWIVKQARSKGVPAPMLNDMARLVRDYVRLERHIVLLTPFQKLFRYWHTFHVPLTIVMGIIVLIHIGVAVAFGYVWEF